MSSSDPAHDTPTPRLRRELRSTAWLAAPLIAECWANLECRVGDTRLVNRYNFFVLEVQQAWLDPACKDPRTLHHRGRGSFMVAGGTIKLASQAR